MNLKTDLSDRSNRLVPTWDKIAPLMQTEFARLSVFVSLIGYLLIFSDVLFENGYPTFSVMLGQPKDAVATDLFLLSATTKWRLLYLGVIFLMIGRITFDMFWPNRLKTKGFAKADFVENAQKTIIRSEIDAMFARVAPRDCDDTTQSEFAPKRTELCDILFPKFNHWARTVKFLNKALRVFFARSWPKTMNLPCTKERSSDPCRSSRALAGIC